MELPDFREFVELRYAALLRTAYLLTGTREGAEDLLQGALLTTMRHWQRIGDPMAYVRRAMVNQRISLWRRIGSRELLTNRFPDRGAPDRSQLLAERDALLAALNRLPARMRAVVVLRYCEDMTEAATAEMLGCSVGTVKSQASHGLRRMRDFMSPKDTEPSAQPAWLGGTE